MTDSKFAVSIALALVLLSLLAGYAFAKLTAPREVDCSVVIRSGVMETHIRYTKCEVEK